MTDRPINSQPLPYPLLPSASIYYSRPYLRNVAYLRRLSSYAALETIRSTLAANYKREGRSSSRLYSTTAGPDVGTKTRIGCIKFRLPGDRCRRGWTAVNNFVGDTLYITRLQLVTAICRAYASPVRYYSPAIGAPIIRTVNLLTYNG